MPALSPLVWNLVIIAFMVAGRGWFDGSAELYAYAIGILAGTGVQFVMALPALRTVGFRLEWSFDLRDPAVKRVFALLLPVTLGLGLVNLNLLANSVLGTFVSVEAPRAIDNAFRLYMLPQGSSRWPSPPCCSRA